MRYAGFVIVGSLVASAALAAPAVAKGGKDAAPKPEVRSGTVTVVAKRKTSKADRVARFAAVSASLATLGTVIAAGGAAPTPHPASPE